jgi:hypothetical protein
MNRIESNILHHARKQREQRRLNNLNNKTMKTYTFSVPCSMLYYIDAKSKKQAKEILQKRGGVDIKGELLIDAHDYHEAYLHE